MKPSTAVARLADYLSWIIAFILIVLPFHAFLTVWASSIFGHYTLLRLWKEFLLVFVLAGVVYILISRSVLRRQFFASKLVRLIIAYIGLILICGIVAFARHTVTAKALAYGVLLDARFLAFFLMVVIISNCSPILGLRWRKLLLIPGAIVAATGLLQYLLLPYDFFKHFGYGPATISPYETINHNIHYIRIASTLRGANPLGAYLVLIIGTVAVLLAKTKKRRLRQVLLAVGALLTLAFSYSRSAWIGSLLTVSIILWLSLKTPRLRHWVLAIAGIVIIVGGATALALRHNASFENTFLHTDNHSQALASSNQGHASAFKNGFRDIYHQPLGRGTGTAGPASLYNNNKGRIAENYFLQIGQEAGILAMALFMAINILVGRQLWLKRAEPLALVLFASLIGLTFVNMLSHAWTDDTLAYLWWGLAAIALAPAILKANKRLNEKTQQKTA